MQTPISSNKRYLTVFFITAIVLFLLATLHVSQGGAIPEVVKSTTGWHSTPDSPPASKPGNSQNIYAGKYDKRPSFTDLAKDSGTDKVTTHNFGVLYDKYLPAFRDDHIKMLEIGLGCGMPYGPGASYRMWIKYFEDLELNIVEYDEVCGKAWAGQNPGANVFFGDQASVPFLRKTGMAVTSDRLLDIVIDDGGHTMTQQRVSLEEMWQFIRPGGIYIAEDLQTSYLANYDGDPTLKDTKKPIFMKYIYELMTDFMGYAAHLNPSMMKHNISLEIQSIDCMEAMCVLTKKEAGAR